MCPRTPPLPNRPNVLSLCEGCPAPLGVTDLSCDIMPRGLNVRISYCELDALDRASDEMGCSRSQVVRLLVHCLTDDGTSLGGGHSRLRLQDLSWHRAQSARSIGTLYNQSVAALNTIAKVARES